MFPSLIFYKKNFRRDNFVIQSPSGFVPTGLFSTGAISVVRQRSIGHRRNSRQGKHSPEKYRPGPLPARKKSPGRIPEEERIRRDNSQRVQIPRDDSRLGTGQNLWEYGAGQSNTGSSIILCSWGTGSPVISKTNLNGVTSYFHEGLYGATCYFKNLILRVITILLPPICI